MGNKILRRQRPGACDIRRDNDRPSRPHSRGLHGIHSSTQALRPISRGILEPSKLLRRDVRRMFRSKRDHSKTGENFIRIFLLEKKKLCCTMYELIHKKKVETQSSSSFFIAERMNYSKKYF